MPGSAAFRCRCQKGQAHGICDHTWFNQRLSGALGSEGLRLASTKASCIELHFASSISASRVGQVCLCRRLVNEDQLLRLFPPEGLASGNPVMPGNPAVSLGALLRDQAFLVSEAGPDQRLVERGKLDRHSMRLLRCPGQLLEYEVRLGAHDLDRECHAQCELACSVGHSPLPLRRDRLTVIIVAASLMTVLALTPEIRAAARRKGSAAVPPSTQPRRSIDPRFSICHRFAAAKQTTLPKP